MKLWILKPINEEKFPWKPWYDRAFCFVVRASNESEARMLASKRAGGESSVSKTNPWLDAERSTCLVLSEEGDPGVLVCDFRSA